jgi:hypothetical protein
MSAQAGAAGPAQAGGPLKELYDFVRNHLAIVNGLVLASGTLVSVLDFLAPKLSILPKLVYSTTAAIVALMILAALAPALVEKALSLVGLAARRSGGKRLWRRPAWQIAVVLLGAVTIAGFASLAKAADGGYMAGKFPAVRSLQESLLSLQRDVADVGAGVRQANEKLDRVVASVDPANVADRCPDLECALQGGASSATVRRLFERGAKVPGNPISDGELLRMAAISRGAGRLETIDLLFQHGVSREAKFYPHYISPGEVTKSGLRWAREVDELAGSTRLLVSKFNPTGDVDLGVWNDANGCFMRTSGGVTMLELAGLLGDEDLARHLIEGGSKLPDRPLACAMSSLGKRGYARVLFDPATARVLAVRAS